MFDHVKEVDHFHQHTWEFRLPERSGEPLEKGNYTWNFEHVVPGNWSESIEGLPHTHIVYRLKAKIERGLILPNTAVRKHVRIIRVLDPNSLDLGQPVV